LSTDENATEGHAYYELMPSEKPVNLNMMDKSIYDNETGNYGWTTGEDGETLIP